MGYSEIQFQRELLKALNKISSELHESNVLAKESVAMQKRMMEINESSFLDLLNAAAHRMSIEELKIMREADAMMCKQEEERYAMISKYNLEKFNAESEDNKEQ